MTSVRWQCEGEECEWGDVCVGVGEEAVCGRWAVSRWCVRARCLGDGCVERGGVNTRQGTTTETKIPTDPGILPDRDDHQILNLTVISAHSRQSQHS